MNKIVHQKDFIEIISKVVAGQQDETDKLIKSASESLKKYIDDIVAGIQLKQGEPGEDGSDCEPEEVAEIILQSEEFKEFISALKPKDGKPGKDGLDSDPHKVAGILLSSDYFIDNIRGKDGDPGKDSDPKEIAARIVSNKEFIEACKGEKGEDSDPAIVANLLLHSEEFLNTCKGKDGKSVDTEEVFVAVKSIVDTEEYKDSIKGDPGKPGKDGQSVKVEEVVGKLMSDDDFVNKIKGDKGAPGDKGSPGQDANPEDVANSLLQDEEFIKAVRGKDGKDAVTADIVNALVNNEEFCKSIKGRNGKDSEPEEVASLLSKDESFLAIVRGKDGKDAETTDIVNALVNNKEFKASIKGEPGTAGEPGRDRPVFDILKIEDGDKLPKNTMGLWGGGLYQSVRNTKGTPIQDPDGWRIILDSVSEASMDYNGATRDIKFKFSMLSGLQHEVSMKDYPRYVRSKNQATIEGDFFFEDTCVKVFHNKEFVSFDLKGDKGDKGDRGSKGRTGKVGNGINEMYMKQIEGFNVLIVELTDGDVKKFQVSPVQEEVKAVDKEIRRFAGVWNAKQKYLRGDLVNSHRGVFIAVSDNPANINDSKDWQQIIPRETSPAISNPIPLSQTYCGGGKGTRLSKVKSFEALELWKGSESLILNQGSDYGSLFEVVDEKTIIAKNKILLELTFTGKLWGSNASLLWGNRKSDWEMDLLSNQPSADASYTFWAMPEAGEEIWLTSLNGELKRSGNFRVCAKAWLKT